ncbi:2-(hydroxymethyl)glutarate dehydrogenase [Roseivivax jejudonensis]|uniref:2-(Hydroxymethyl)glutarate dehydrogenase n=1 Tax=Roseivivax jejudonensis TaxID=1529041 RepID=A0A1X6ZXJ4_9RHOB|nr:NAD(P)-dependent oxidoreductase [Roseivivax jejudonensis]SLN64490.1 2-(hydroxymethyl)glutarate dehydrogenase [Roseivivax jejudonensis]
MQVGFVGLGAMGAAMAGHVVRAGHDVIGYDTDADALDAAREQGVVPVGDLADIAGRAEVVIVVVATDAQSRAVVEALIAAGQTAGSVIAVAATNHPKTMIALAEHCAEAGVGFVDAPVCYGLQGAKAGDLISLCGGAAADVEKAEPVLSAYSRSVEHLGPSGSGQLGKTCNNMMHWAACVANYEVLALAKSCGIDAQAMRETLLKCPARNTTLERWDTSRFTWHQKDMDVALDLSQQAGLALPLFGAVDQLVKRLGPDRVRELLHEDEAEYLGLPIAVRSLREVTAE